MHATSTSSVINCACACNSLSHPTSAASSCARVKLHVKGMTPDILSDTGTSVPRPQQHSNPEQLGRIQTKRAVILGLGLLPFADTWLRRACAAEGDVKFLETESSVIGRFVQLKDHWQRFETLDFQLQLPTEYRFVGVPQQPAPSGRGRVAPPSAVKASFADPDGRSVTVVEYSASQVKPTFFQLADISQYGNVLDVAKLLTPPGAKIMSLKKIVVEQPERDTGTIRGKVKAAPQTIYRFDYELGSGVRVATAAVARAGKVLLAGGTASGSQWDAQPEVLRLVIDSFQLTFPN